MQSFVCLARCFYSHAWEQRRSLLRRSALDVVRPVGGANMLQSYTVQHHQVGALLQGKGYLKSSHYWDHSQTEGARLICILKSKGTGLVEGFHNRWPKEENSFRRTFSRTLHSGAFISLDNCIVRNNRFYNFFHRYFFISATTCNVLDFIHRTTKYL